MRADLLWEHFDTLIRTPEDVKALEAAILDLAVRGKLVPQDPNDEPAGVLLERIRQRRADLVEAGEIRKPRQLPKVDNGNSDLAVPDGWMCCRLGDLILDIRGGKTPSKRDPRYWGGIFPWASVKDLHDGVEIVDTQDHITDEALSETGVYVLPRGNVVVCTRMGLGKINLNEVDLAINQDLKGILLPPEINRRYFYYMYQTLEIIGSGMTVKGIRQDDLLALSVPLPPFLEQQRIVERIEQMRRELRALADELQAADELLEPAARASFQALVEAPDRAARREAWQRIEEGFEALTSDPRTIDALKQTILDLAVRGLLVPQDPNDEPAGELLEDVGTNNRAFRSEADGSAITGPYVLPSGWVWATLPELGELARGRSRHRPRNDPRLFEEGQYPFIQTGDVAQSEGRITSYDTMYSEFGLNQSRLWPSGTLCITIAANIAQTGILAFDACFPDSVVGFIPSSDTAPVEYFQYVIQVAQAELEAYAPATAQKNINLGVLSELRIPVPPTREAKRIVAKVEELIRLCALVLSASVSGDVARTLCLQSALNSR